MIVEDWSTREAFEAWWDANVRELNAMAINPPPDPRDPEIVLNPEWHRIIEHIDAWKIRQRL